MNGDSGWNEQASRRYGHPDFLQSNQAIKISQIIDVNLSYKKHLISNRT